MWFELTPHGMRKITEDEILAVTKKIRTRRAIQQGGGHGAEPPSLLPCQMPSHSHTFNPCGGFHAHCHCCPRR